MCGLLEMGRGRVIGEVELGSRVICDPGVGGELSVGGVTGEIIVPGSNLKGSRIFCDLVVV